MTKPSEPAGWSRADLKAEIDRLLGWDGPIMTAWDKARQTIIDGDRGSLARDIMEAALSEFYELPDAIMALAPPSSLAVVGPARQLPPPDGGGPEPQCGYCAARFWTRQELAQHVHSSHGGPTPSSSARERLGAVLDLFFGQDANLLFALNGPYGATNRRETDFMLDVQATLAPPSSLDGGGAGNAVMTDIFEREFDGDDDPRLRVARCITRAEAEAILEHSGDMIAALAAAPLPVGEPTPEPEICARGEWCVCMDPSPSRCNAFKDASKMPPLTGRVDT